MRIDIKILNSLCKIVVLYIVIYLLSINVSADSGYTLNWQEENGKAVVAGITVSDDVSLVDVIIPQNVVIDGKTLTTAKIASMAFRFNAKINSVSIPETVTEIGDRAFAMCTNMTEVNIPDGIEEIKQFTFSDCSKLKSLFLPSSLKKFAAGAIKNCPRLEYVVFGSENLEIVCESNESLAGYFSDYGEEQNPFPEKFGKKTVTGGYVYGRTRFYTKSQNVADVLKSNGIYEQYIYCGKDYGIDKNLSDGMFSFDGYRTPNGNFAVVTGFSAGKLPSGKMTLQIPQTFEYGSVSYTVTEIGEAAFSNEDISKRIIGAEFPASLTNIREFAFHNCDIGKVTIPANVRYIGDYAFKSNYYLVEINFENGVRGFGTQVFYYTAVRYVVLPESIEYIDPSAFMKCAELSVVAVAPDSLVLGGSMPGELKSACIYVRSEAAKNAFTAAGASNVVYNEGGMLVLKPERNYNIPDVLYSNGEYTLPGAERKMFEFTGWTDGNEIYYPGDVYTSANRLEVLSAVWSFDADSDERVTADLLKDSIINDEYYACLLSKNESSKVTRTQTITANVSESSILKEVDRRVLGTSFSNDMVFDGFFDYNTSDMSESFKALAKQIHSPGVIRSNMTDFIGFFDDLELYDDNNNLLKLKSVMNAWLGASLEIDAEAEFVFIIPLHKSEDEYISPEAVINFHKFMTDESDASAWGKLRDELGFPAVCIIAYELGNETYHNCRELEASQENAAFIAEDCALYAESAKTYCNIFAQNGIEVEFSASLVADIKWWQTEWNRNVIKNLNSYVKGLYSLHTYYSYRNRPTWGVNEVCDHINELYIEEAGHDYPIRFAHTEHALWVNTFVRRSVAAALAEGSFLNNIMLRDDTFCANYYTLYTGRDTLWGIISDSKDGKPYLTTVADFYNLYADNLGDRIISVEYDTFTSYASAENNEYAISPTNEAPSYTFSMICTADGEDTVRINLVNTYSDDVHYNAITVNFNFENEYTLCEETVFYGDNAFSQEAKTITNSSTVENFSQYTLAPNSAAFLVLKSNKKIPSYSSQQNIKESDNVIYRDVLYDAPINDEGEIQLENPMKIDRIIYTGNESDIKIYGKNEYGKLELIATEKSFKDGNLVVDFTDSLFDSVRVLGADITKLAVLSALSEDRINAVHVRNGNLKLYTRLNGEDCFDYPDITTTSAVSYEGMGIFKINSLGSASVEAGNMKRDIYLTTPESKLTVSDSFDNPDSGNWIASPLYTNSLFDIIDGKLKMSTDSQSPSAVDYACVTYGGKMPDCSDGVLSFDIERSYKSFEMGVDFKIHNDGLNFYRLGFQKFSSAVSNLSWTLYKITNGESEVLSNGIYNDWFTYDSVHVVLSVDNGHIEWKAFDNGTGYVIKYFCGAYDDENPFKTAQGSFGFYAYGQLYNLNSTSADCYVSVDNVRFEALSGYENSSDALTAFQLRNIDANGNLYLTKYTVISPADKTVRLESVEGISTSNDGLLPIISQNVKYLDAAYTLTDISPEAFTENVLSTDDSRIFVYASNDLNVQCVFSLYNQDRKVLRGVNIKTINLKQGEFLFYDIPDIITKTEEADSFKLFLMDLDTLTPYARSFAGIVN